MKKVIALVFAVLMGQVFATSDVDLYRGLLFWIQDQYNIEGNESRKTTYSLSKAFDGSFSNSLDGVALPAKGSISFTLAFSFKVGKQDCLNRILRIGARRHFYVDADNRLCSAIPVGSGTVYKEFKSSLVVRENAWYSIVLRQEDDKHVYLFAGEKDAELGCVADYEDSKIIEIDSADVSMGSIVFGSCDYPSPGNLQSGQFANIRFWTRALTNDECVMADVCRDVILETKQLGCPSGAKYDFFPLGGNLFGVDESCITPKNASRYNVSGYGWCEEAGRLSSTGYAMSSDGGGRIVYKDFSELFGTTVFGESFKNSSYSYEHGGYGITYTEYKIHSLYPDKPCLSFGSVTNASYVFWLRVDRFPDSANHVIFSRNIRDSLASEFPEDKEVCLKVNPEGKLVLRQNGVDTTLGGACLRMGEWALISVIGHAKGSITVFVNKVKAGSVSSSITMGALCGIDTRYEKTKYSYIFATEQWGYPETSSGGEATRPITDMTIGGWDGAIDEIAFYGKALSVDEVTEIYEASCPPDPYTSINPTRRNFTAGGGGGAIITSGSSETWRARVSEPWITLNANNGNIGYPVAYAISATTNAEQRIGFVYINGHVHTVTQDGAGGTIASNGATFEHEGGTDTIAIEVQNGIAWKATPNVGWLSVSQRSGIGSGSVLYRALPYDEVATRQGTLTIAGNTFTVFQYGRRMKLDSYSTTQNYEAHVIPITVNALDTTQWSVMPNNGWISIVDGGNGKGGDLVTIAIAENPSYKERTGTVTIGTETFTVTQQGRPTAALSFNVSPTSSTASVDGANGLVSVTATPDLPWTATSGANWLTIYAATTNGAGNGNVVYVASPNPTLSKRTGKITVTPEAASGMTAKSHTVTQPAAQSSLSISGYEFEVSGEPCSVEVSCADIVQWSVSESLDWLTVNGSTSRTGPGTVVLQAAANNTVYPRSGTVTIAGKAFTVSQKARGVEIEYDSMLFDTDGGYESISIHPDGNSAWTAVASDPTWITIFQGDSGTGDGEILYIVAPYVGDGSVRTGWITVGDKKVLITQRPYDLSISPNGAVVKGNSGAGEFGVSANIGAVWNAIVTEPWIALVSGYDAGTGSGTVRFICEDNNTGKARVGKIVVAGEVYTVTQSARILVQIQAEAGHGGSLTGSGTYDKGEKIVLTAVPDSGYRFVRWTGPVESTDNPFVMDADDMSGIRAEFEPMPIEFTTIRSSPDGVYLAWKSLAWATSYRLLRGSSDDASAAEELATFLSGAVDAYCDETGDIGVTHWYWVEAVGALDRVVSESVTGMRKPIVNSPITYTNLNGARHSNPDTYVEGRSMSFSHPSARTGYTFTGWTPARITEEMTGAQTVRAGWTANRYSIVYHANGGNGSMAATEAEYDAEAVVAANGFSRAGHSFAGWATNATGKVVYEAGRPVTNLTAEAGAEIDLYATWTVNQYTVTFDSNGGIGGKTVTQNCGTALVAPTVTRTGYTFTGWSPSVPATVPAGNATYVAQWTKNKYTVTFDANGGSGGWSRSMDYGAAIVAPTVTREGYTFVGWTPTVDATVPTGDVAYTAQWKINQYTVTFDSNGGIGGKTVTQNCGTALVAPTVTRTGYTFTGWSPSVPATVPAENATYVAQWAPNTYVVTYRPGANGSGSQRTATKMHGIALKLSGVIFTRSGYTQTGWATSDGGVKAYDLGAAYTANAAVTLYPYWERAKIQLWENGPYWAATNIGADKPEDSGYYFWWGDTVGYKRENGVWVASNDSSHNFSFGSNVPTYNMCEDRLRREGWITENDVLAPAHDAAQVQWGGDWRMPTNQELDDLIGKCDWTWTKMNGVNGVVVRGKGNYSSNSIFLPAADSVLPDDCCQLWDGTVDGPYGLYWSSTPDSDYYYYSWYLSFGPGGRPVDYTYVRDDGFSIRPVQGFVAPVKVTLGKNGGTGGDNYVTATYGNPMPTPRTAPTLSGWTFAGYWDTLALDEKGNPKGKQYYDANMKSVRNWDKKAATTLWAKWTNKVTFGKNGGTGGDNYVTCTKGQPMPKRTMPTKSGYVFDGYWTTTGAGGVKYYNADGTSAHAWDKGGSVTLWAKWVAATFKVTFGKNGGTGGDNYVTATTGKAMPTPRTAPTLKGWSFGGYWDTLACDAKGNPLGKQYYNSKMESVRNWDKTAATTLWAKWTVKVTLGKNGGTGGDSTVTVIKGQPFPKRTMPTKSGYTFGGYFVSASSKTGQCYNPDGTGTASMKWSTGGTPTIWALWTKTSACVELPPAVARRAASVAPEISAPAIPAGLYSGVLADGTGAFLLMLDEAEKDAPRTAYLYVASEDGSLTAECAAEELGDVLLLTTEDGAVYAFDPKAGTLGFAMGTP